MGEFTKLKVWQKAHELTLKVYMLTNKLPSSEAYGLISQLRRAAVPVESLIAEGEDRYTAADKNKFFIDARASCAEIRTQLLIIKDLHPELSKESLILKKNILSLQSK